MEELSPNRISKLDSRSSLPQKKIHDSSIVNLNKITDSSKKKHNRHSKRTCPTCEDDYRTEYWKNHTDKCVQYYQFVSRKKDQEEQLFGCKFCEIFLSTKIGTIFRHLEAKHHNQMFSNGDYEEIESKDDKNEIEAFENNSEESKNIRSKFRFCQSCQGEIKTDTFITHNVKCVKYFHAAEKTESLDQDSGKIQNTFTCKLCHNSHFSKVGHFFRHLEAWHNYTKIYPNIKDEIEELKSNESKIKRELLSSMAQSLSSSNRKRKTYPCQICNEQFRQDKFRKHTIMCQKYFKFTSMNEDNMLICDLCENSPLFSSCGNLYLHMEKRHSQISSLKLTPSKIKRENYDDPEENQDAKYDNTNSMELSFEADLTDQSTFELENFKFNNEEESGDTVSSQESNGLENPSKMQKFSISDAETNESEIMKDSRKRRVIICKICNENVRSDTQYYKNHIAECQKYYPIVKKTGDNGSHHLLECGLCQNVFAKIGKLYEHIRIIHGDENIPSYSPSLLSRKDDENDMEKSIEKNSVKLISEMKFSKRHRIEDAAQNSSRKIRKTRETVQDQISDESESEFKEEGDSIDATSLTKIIQDTPEISFPKMMKECYFCTMCKEITTFKSCNSKKVRQHMAIQHSFSIEMQQETKFGIRCVLVDNYFNEKNIKCDIDFSTNELDMISDEVHICRMCDKNNSFLSSSALDVRRHIMEKHNFPLDMQFKYNCEILCILFS